MESPPGETIIRNFVKYNYGLDNQTRTGTVSPCRTFQPDNNKPPQGNKKMFPQELSRPHIGVNKEVSGNID